MTAEQELKRIEVLRKYDILDTPPDGTFDHIVKMAARLLDMPIALVTLVDTDRIWFKSAFGLNVQQIEREDGLCSSAILSNEFYMVEDALRDPRTHKNSLVTSEFGLRFYAAVPLTTSDGYNLGNLTVLDKKPRTLDKNEQKLLEDLAQIVIDQMELRLVARSAINSQNKMAYMITHDIHNAVCVIPPLIDMIKENKESPEEVDNLGDMITHAVEKSLEAVDSFMNYANSLFKDITYRIEPCNFSEIIRKVISTNNVLALKKQQQITSQVEENIFINGDRARLSELIDNLLSNAIKYSPKGKKIFVSFEKKDQAAILSVRDEGQGITSEDMKNAFKRFSKLSALPTGNEHSTGLGLWIVKEIVERHKGKVEVQSDGKDKGATFTVTLPVCDKNN